MTTEEMLILGTVLVGVAAIAACIIIWMDR